MHISELAPHHVESPREIVHPGDEIRVKILEIDSERRRLSLSAKRVEDQILPVVAPGRARRASRPSERRRTPSARRRRRRGRRRAPRPPAEPSARSRRRRGARAAGAEAEAAPAEAPARGARGRGAAEAQAARGRGRPGGSRGAGCRGAAEDAGRPRTAPAPQRRPAQDEAAARPTPTAEPPHGLTRPARRAEQRASRRCPFVGLTGGIGAGKSTALAALERLGAAVISSDAVVHELYAGEQLRDAVVARCGPEVAPGGVVDRAAVARARVRDAPRSARGSSGCSGRSSARASAAWLRGGARPRPAAAGGRGRGAAAVRGGPGGASTTRRSRSSPTRSCARERAAGRGHALRRRARRAPALPGGEGAARDVRRAQRRQRGGSRARAVGGACQAWAMSQSAGSRSASRPSAARVRCSWRCVAARERQARRRATAGCRSRTRASSANRRPPSTSTRR